MTPSTRAVTKAGDLLVACPLTAMRHSLEALGGESSEATSAGDRYLSLSSSQYSRITDVAPKVEESEGERKTRETARGNSYFQERRSLSASTTNSPTRGRLPALPLTWWVTSNTVLKSSELSKHGRRGLGGGGEGRGRYAGGDRFFESAEEIFLEKAVATLEALKKLGGLRWTLIGLRVAESEAHTRSSGPVGVSRYVTNLTLVVASMANSSSRRRPPAWALIAPTRRSPSWTRTSGLPSWDLP